MILLALISLNLPQPWPDLSNTVVCLYFKSVPYRKVRNRKCKQNSRRVGPCFEHMPWYKWGFKSLDCFWIVSWKCLNCGRTSLFISPFTLLSLSSCSPFYVKFHLCFPSKCLKDRASKRRRKPKTFDLLSKQGYYHFVGHCDAFWEICLGLNTFAKIGQPRSFSHFSKKSIHKKLFSDTSSDKGMI